MALDDYNLALNAKRDNSGTIIDIPGNAPVSKTGTTRDQPAEIWDVQWKTLTKTEYQALRDEFLAVGTHTPLSITMPGESSTRDFAFLSFAGSAASALGIAVSAKMIFVPGVS